MGAWLPGSGAQLSRIQHCLVLRSHSKDWRLVSAEKMGSLGLSFYHRLPVQLWEYFLYLNSSAKALSILHNIPFPGGNIPIPFHFQATVASRHPQPSSVTSVAIYQVSVSQCVARRPPAAESLRSSYKHHLFWATQPHWIRTSDCGVQDSVSLTSYPSGFREHSSFRNTILDYVCYLPGFPTSPWL